MGSGRVGGEGEGGNGGGGRGLEPAGYFLILQKSINSKNPSVPEFTPGEFGNLGEINDQLNKFTFF